MVIDVTTLNPFKKTPTPSPLISKSPSPAPSLTPKLVEKPLTPSPSKPSSSSQICDHVFAEAYDMKTGKHYKRCLYCRATDLPFKIVRIK